jgi:hypothetical protein
MKASGIELNTEVMDELNEVLDREQRRVDESLAQLQALRSALIRRDEAGLQEMLSRIQARQAEYVQLDHRREWLCERLAGWMGCERSEVNLTRLIRDLPPEAG